MKELERQRVCRIAMDHAMRMQEAEEPPPKTCWLVKTLAAVLAGSAATAAIASMFFP